MKINLCLISLFLFFKISSGQINENFAGTYLLENRLDSVNLTIDKNGTFKTISTSICHGDNVLSSKGKWNSNGDTVTLVTFSRTKAGEKPKIYEYKPKSSYLLKLDSLLLLGNKKLLQPEFSYRRISRNATYVYSDGQKVFPVSGKVFVGASINKNYKCWLKIYKDSTISFIYQDNRKYDFGEFSGTIRKLTDTTFHISCTMTFGQGVNKMLSDTPNIAINNTVKFDTLTVRYSSGLSKTFLIQDTTSFIALSTQKWGDYKTNDSLTLTISRKHLITNTPLKFVIPFGSSAFFFSGEKEEFDILIKNNTIKTIGKPPAQPGHFKLKTKK